MSKVQENMSPPRETTIPDDYKTFLNRWHCKKGQEYTHTSIANPKVSLHVPDENYNEFLEKYKSFMVKGYSLHLTEKPVNPSIMRVDLDFRFVLPDDKSKLQIIMLKILLNIIVRYLKLFWSYQRVV